MRMFRTKLLVLAVFYLLFFSKYQFLPCWNKIWDDRILFAWQLELSNTIKILAKKKKGWTNKKNYPPVDHILFHLGLLSQNAAEKHPQHTQSMRCFFKGSKWKFSCNLYSKHRMNLNLKNNDRMSCSSWMCKMCDSNWASFVCLVFYSTIRERKLVQVEML